MSSYTITIKEILEMWTHNTASSTSDRIEKGRQKLFDFDYPIFDPTYKAVFETHFIRKFYMREIGFETEGLFKFQLETWLLINMPYFNNLFKSELLTYDPLQNSNLAVKKDRTNDQTSNVSSNSKGTNNATNKSTNTASDNRFNRELESNNPDERLAITSNNGSGVIQYASAILENNETNSKNESATITGSDTSNVDSSSNAAVNNVEDYIETRIGKTGDQSYPQMVKEFRESFLRIENKLFNEMNELFMLVY